jgi:hypothetical protein
MCAYNVRRKRSLDTDPERGVSRATNFLRSLAIWALGALAIYLLYLLSTRYLF